jgi:hypothetical protein
MVQKLKCGRCNMLRAAPESQFWAPSLFWAGGLTARSASRASPPLPTG